MDKSGKKPTANNVKCWESNEEISAITQRLKEMFVDMGQKSRIERGQKPAQRSVFRKQHGIAYGHFIIDKDLNPEFAEGIFAGEEYECVARFSSDTDPQAPDLHSTLGLGLKLFGVHGPKLIGEGETADFIFQNIDRFFAKDARQMCSFTTAGVIDRDYDTYINEHPELAGILKAMMKEEASCLTAGYWAILPFKLGDKNIVKYRLVPEVTDMGAPANDKNYLARDLQRRLRTQPASFRFEIQLRSVPSEMPLDDAQKVWDTDQSPYIPIARLVFPKQDILAIGQEEFGSNLAFNIWRTLPAHEPLGSIAKTRKTVYAASAKARHQANGQQQQEPREIEPVFSDDEDDSSECIVKAAIYPPIGVMRVGNSREEYFIGPLTDQPVVKEDPYAYRDASGALKRQAAQFRVYGLNAAGKAVKELSPENANITWHAHLANQKSSWYQFQLALDIPEAKNAPASLLRNIDEKDRKPLLIDGKHQSISGTGIENGPKFTGHFKNKEVYLGEMRTDQKGRLLMLGGHGKSENISGDMAVTFANNEGWYDDISDGPVTAEVEYEGVTLKTDPAWVICAPPDYAPMQKSVRTMWDLMRDVAVKSNMLVRPARPSFTEDILPIFERMTDLQWVNAGFAAAFGFGGQFNYTSREWINKLNDPSPAFLELRRSISNNFRRYDVPGAQAPQLWPWLYGDAISIPPTGSVRQHCTLSDLQLSFLEQWAEGDFDADFGKKGKCPFSSNSKTIDELPLKDQPDMLTKAAMDFCLADAFHPGCEMTWPMRTAGMYMAPFRLKHATKTEPMNSWYYGAEMNTDVITLAKGPLLGGQVARGITRWMAIPWQTDTASCRDGYTASYDPYVPTFWPARVPNNILSEDRYNEVLNDELSEETRKQAFAYRRDWLDDLPLNGNPPTYTNQINSMIKHFDNLAVIQARKGVDHSEDFPYRMQVGISLAKEQEETIIRNAGKQIELLHQKTLNPEHKKSLEHVQNKLSSESMFTAAHDQEITHQHLATLIGDENIESHHKEDLIRLLGLLSKKVKSGDQKPLHPDHEKNENINTGIPSKLGRFHRFLPE
ncbi:LodA/GoxA family CTQ-dependent oxidase [Zunongwangia sp. F363]|uniref:LodA/GoxA family CTQ-dependent oxidase n=1 Tax=Autumnicola tepida TaxID=3075595 RepID=A0ABU3C778_9FLAO|nr:LodA/GoxA family CTQ-dependent oxidase [Zunongwangia sp. F363]MDT0642198.1 LodA/GoxA family CTQ-dependent oxidase [Zunongwangia sp. F363]